MEQEAKSHSERWKDSRSGARAGRGFHYQDLISLLIIVRQWAGLFPAGSIVPEGLEDCVVELENKNVWVQVKSKKSGNFGKAKVNSVLSEVKGKLGLIKSSKQVSVAVVIEQLCSAYEEKDIVHLFDDSENNIIVCKDPEDEAMAILLEKLGIADILVKGLITDIYHYIAVTAQANASVTYENRIRISTTDIEKRITDRLEAEDPSAIDSALLSKTLKPIDFKTPVHDDGFYQGVKARAGHVASGQILRRDDEMQDIATKLKHHRHLLVTGQSGAGKSSLVWLVAESLLSSFRWFQINQISGIENASEIISFITSRCPRQSSPIALVFDEVGSLNSELWNQLAIELRGFSDVYLLGSIRTEDTNLITNQYDTELVPVLFDENIAKDIWEQLGKKNETVWNHWREPFENSKGLMLEYIHILTQGKRLSALIKEQIIQREKEKRENELSIIRATSVFNSHGGEVEVKKLFQILDLSQADASEALKRLLGEHLVTEARSGILGGLHGIRSKALAEASHDDVVYQTNESLHRYITAVTTETLPHVIRSVFDKLNDDKERNQFLKVLSKILSKDNSLNLSVAVFTGLGLATLEKETKKLISVLEKNKIQPSLWTLASMFAVANTEIPDLPNAPRYDDMRNAILEYRKLPKHDYRAECLDSLSDKKSLPQLSGLEEANKFLSCFVPIAGGEALDISLSLDFSIKGEPNIQEIADFLSTAYYVNPKLSEEIVLELGGEEKLFSWTHNQVPWITKPIIEEGEHGRTIRADWFSLSNDEEMDINQEIVDVCEILMAISPESGAAACDALDPSGKILGINGLTLHSKNMPRENIPEKAQLAWNVAFRQIILSHIGNESLTEYVQEIIPLVKEAEKVFRYYTEKWIRNETVKDFGAFADSVNALNNKINDLAYTESSIPSYVMNTPADSAGEDDGLGGCLSGVLTNLMDRINTSQGNDNKLIAVNSGDFSSRLKEQLKSLIWRTSSKPPIEEISNLIERLEDVSNIYHELAFNSVFIKAIVNKVKKEQLGSAVHAAGNYCRDKADIRLNKKLKKVEDQLKKQGCEAKCWLKPENKEDSPFWPSVEVAILVNISNFEKDLECFDDSFEIASKIIKDSWSYCIVPVINNQVISDLALNPPTQFTPSPLPYFNFKEDWQDYINKLFFKTELTSKFDKAMGACIGLSAIIACRDIDNLHEEEDNFYEECISTYKSNKEVLDNNYDEREVEIVGLALNHLEDTWDRMVAEFELFKKGEKSDSPLCMESYDALSGVQNDNFVEMATIRILLIQEETTKQEEA